MRRHVTAYGFLSLALVVFAVFSWYPIVRGVVLSFQQVNFVSDPEWVGWENFRRLFDDPLFAVAWRNTAYYTVLALLIGFGVPFLTAVVLNELRHAKGYFRLLVYLPVMLPPVVTALLWKWFYDPGPGLFNSVLRGAGLPGLQWLDSADTSLISIVLLTTWANMGAATLIYLAALQTIPGELYEAAELDGAGIFRKVWNVTIPQTKFVLLMLLLLQVVATMQVFTEPFIMTGGGPGGLDRHGPAPALPLRLRLQRLRHRQRAQPHPVRGARRLLLPLPQAHQEGGRVRTLTKPGGKLYWVVLALTLVLFTVAFLVPLVWVLLGAFKPPAELAQQPPTVLPRTWEPGAYADAWNYMDLGKFFLNTVVVAFGAWAVQMVVIIPAAYALSKLKPLFGNVVLGLMLATMMLPATALLVPVYLTLTDLDLLNNPAGIWLPAAANALNVYLLKRFFDQIPEELLEAARMDGASTWTVLTRIVLPISRPILAVVSIFTVVAAWKDFIWPLLVFPDPAKQTLSVALQRFAPDTPINLLLAGLVLASLPMVALFLAFQRHILAGLTAGSIKG